jgi:RNA polymerase sigma-70 factor (ECF subfamily)
MLDTTRADTARARPPSHCDDDRALVRAALAGSERAFETLVKRYDRAIVGRAYAMLGDRDAALDVRQIVFLATYLSLHRLRDGASLRAWFAVVTRNAAANVLARRDVARRASEGLCDPSETASSTRATLDPQTLIARSERAGAMRALLETLPPDQRDLLVARYYEGASFDELGFRLGATPKSARARVLKAKRRMRAALLRAGERERDTLGLSAHAELTLSA